ncbi:Membrane protein [Croceitalea dokdonensis DOKDO 023]|uniref:Membrane protein n=1 Tax=Croceitalea dokdonensis DOKDO 023 TaxID=1300341 RepID=A0A0P7B094_9FLAO|nr:hypothetical protein [Croceitalea dokdonensis]KPM31299.1 Membrane protein [Croceitalea dokdonensis DOKDO 023]
MHKILKIVLIVIGVIGAALSFFFMPSGDDPEAINSGAIDLMFILTWILLIAASAFALFFGLKKMMTSPGGLKKALFALGGLAVLFIVGYALSSGDEAKAVVDTFSGKDIQPTESTVKTIGMMLNVFFMMTGVAVLLMVLPGVKRLIGK